MYYMCRTTIIMQGYIIHMYYMYRNVDVMRVQQSADTCFYTCNTPKTLHIYYSCGTYRTVVSTPNPRIDGKYTVENIDTLMHPFL